MRYFPDPSGSVSIVPTLKINQKALEILDKAYNDKLNQSDLDGLFKDNDFQETSGYISVLTIFKYYELGYTPIHYLGAVKIANPSLPILHLGGLTGSEVRLSRYFYFSKAFPLYDLTFAPSFVYQDQSTFNTDIDIIASIGAKTKDLVKKKKKISANSDLAIALVSRNDFLPSLSITGRNLLSDTKECSDCDSNFYAIHEYQQPSISSSLYFRLSHIYGSTFTGFNLPHQGIFKKPKDHQASAVFLYTLSGFTLSFSYSPVKEAFGFLSQTDGYELGLMYSNEKQPNDLSTERKDNTYVFAKFTL